MTYIKREKTLIKYSDPWEHIVYHSYYDPELFRNAQLELLSYVKSNKALRAMNYINSLEEFPHTKACVDSSPITESLIEQFTYSRPYTSVSARHQIIICVGESSFPIHDEIPKKILSAVTYVWSNNGTGTRLYNADKQFSKEVEWEPNKLVAFCGMDNLTWHSYYAKPGSVRITLNTFLEQL